MEDNLKKRALQSYLSDIDQDLTRLETDERSRLEAFVKASIKMKVLDAIPSYDTEHVSAEIGVERGKAEADLKQAEERRHLPPDDRRRLAFLRLVRDKIAEILKEGG